MQKLVLGLLAGFVAMVAACGGGGNPPQIILDSNNGDGPTTTNCNPVTQTNCNANEKCTWQILQDSPGPNLPSVGQIACATLQGNEVGPNMPCTVQMAAQGGVDNCEKGSVCVGGLCKTICDFNMPAASNNCPNQFACTRYANLFVVAGTITAGGCDPHCDPLTHQMIPAPGSPSCGVADAVRPNQTCISVDGFKSFSCVRLPMGSFDRKDRDMPLTNQNGDPFGNGCEAGYFLGIGGMTGSAVRLCAGIGAYAPISNQAGEAANKLGSPTAVAKLVGEAAPGANKANCLAINKGSPEEQNCRPMWGFLRNMDGSFIDSPFGETLCMCFSYLNYMVDSNSDGTPDGPEADCSTLPRRSAATTGLTDDRDDFKCGTKAEFMSVLPQQQAVHHDFRFITPPVAHE
jgi:hypothetical protein